MLPKMLMMSLDRVGNVFACDILFAFVLKVQIFIFHPGIQVFRCCSFHMFRTRLCRGRLAMTFMTSQRANFEKCVLL